MSYFDMNSKIYLKVELVNRKISIINRIIALKQLIETRAIMYLSSALLVKKTKQMEHFIRYGPQQSSIIVPIVLDKLKHDVNINDKINEEIANIEDIQYFDDIFESAMSASQRIRLFGGRVVLF